MLNNPLRYTDPTGHFTEDAIVAYLQNMYGDQWQHYWDAWSADQAWWSFITTAHANDIFAQGPQLYMFVGTGEIELTGVGIVWAGEAPTPRFVESFPVNDFFLGLHGPRVSNLIRPVSTNGFETVSTVPFTYRPNDQYGALEYTVSLRYHQVGEAEARVNHGMRTIGITAAVAGGTWALGFPAAAATFGGIVSEPVIDFVASELLDYGLSDFGTSAGDMRFYLVTDIGGLLGPYRGGTMSTTLMWGRENWR